MIRTRLRFLGPYRSGAADGLPPGLCNCVLWDTGFPGTPFTLMVSVLRALQAAAPRRTLWSDGRKQLERSPAVKAVGGQRTEDRVGKEGISSFGAWTFINCTTLICLSEVVIKGADILPMMRP